MKKFLIAMAALMTLAFIGCEKEEEPATDALTGTTWTSSYGGTPLAVSFNAGGIVTLNMGSETYTGTYTYNAPNVAIQMPIDGRNVAFTGTYSNGTLNISSSEYGSFVFTQTGGTVPDESGDDGEDGDDGKSDDEGEPGDDNESENPAQGPAAGVKLVKQVIGKLTDNGETRTIIYKAEYDEQNRMVKVTEEEGGYTGTVLFSYSGNEITVSVRDLTFILTLNDNGYITKGVCKEYEDGEAEFYYDNDGRIIKGVGNYQSEIETYTYDWSDGNLVRKLADGYIDRELTYDESKTLVPTNVNFATVSESIEVFFIDEARATLLLDIWGKQCKSPLKQVVYGGSYVENYSYEFYEDGVVSKITLTHNDIADRTTSSHSYEFTYF